jgi:hypothetical protein
VNGQSRRSFLKTLSIGAAALAAPSLALGNAAPALACVDDGLARPCGNIVDTPEGALPGFEPWWVAAYLPTKLWPAPREYDTPIGLVEVGQHFKVIRPQDGPRLRVWDPRTNDLAYVGAEAVGPAAEPSWAKLLNGLDSRWIDVSLSYPHRAVAMQGDLPMRRALVITGMPGYETQRGYHQILRRVANETMDSSTIPGMKVRYKYTNVLYTQYFTGDGAAIHYNYWAGSFGSPGSRGCLGMTLADSKWFWDWADLGVPLLVHA